MSRLPNHVTLELTEADWDEAAEAYKDSRPCEIEDWELCQHCALSVAAVRQLGGGGRTEVTVEVSDAVYVEQWAHHEIQSYTAPNLLKLTKRFDRYVRRRATKPKKWPILLELREI